MQESARGDEKKQAQDHPTRRLLVDTTDPTTDERHSGDGQASPSGENMVDEVSLSSDDSDLSGYTRRCVPRVNCPEKIILCVDLSPEMNESSFQSRTAPERTAYQFVRKASQIFIKNKSYLNPDHEFGIIVLEDEASWYQQFESNPDTICTVLEHLKPNEQETEDVFDMETLFQAIQSRISLPDLEDPSLPPPYVVRVILMYGRSLCTPVISTQAHQTLHNLLQSPYFFFDVIYVHQLPSENNKCESIYDTFCELDEDEVGYMLEVSRSTTRLFDHMATLLAHPLQRPKQRDTSYVLTPRESDENQ
ncbi:BRISC and BRCA1-A complex member 1-like [Actinia tenebrosa]|uniref:BRISC and BRCA1-A complex member 1 n=1 Tax=Actinia tenebrosa TaxID=6105 RepID=A0A6P8IMD6_ACTTE|nr:BRISC and BRCA1-A complex member 1-like [Actinia tenebrosa]XP_031568004.1 BRISC and BRCA1-A complex member 1-like [Actinia tenebrosa]